MLKKRILSTILLLLLAGIIFRLAENNSKLVSFSASGKPTIKVGAILMLSGVGADYGENSQKGIELAVKEINQQGGILGKTLEVIYQDNEGDNPLAAVNAYKNLRFEGVKFIIGPNWTPSALSLLPLVDKDQALMISPSVGVAEFAKNSPNTFNVWPPDEQATYQLAEFVYNQGYRTVGVFGSKQQWEKAQAEFFKKRFEALGGRVGDMELPLEDQTDLRTESLRIKASLPQAVIFTDLAHMDVAARSLKRIGINVPFFSVLLDQKNIELAQGALEGTVFVTFHNPTAEFEKKFLAAYGREPRVSADTAYDALKIFAQAIARAGSMDVTAVRRVLSGIQQWNGAAGVFLWDSYGNASRKAAFYEVKNNTIIKYSK